ncbi:MAG: hypothetical protein GWN99_00195 [Gemmatimonadetes bacterium]|uniref:Uncharacterized protein n=1 Tax=Candidatus Kutchimonas denitrificans TaxID=3056748 RepID=A0AAE4Z6B9_9BACT|nr:hypothetical protein [Gemmatimonadota bacterium]NIR73527.1 hypothetical protein [Candidatus Kutchimonas denitrificans]NIR99486.1 hypothetical protein [Gemmatimonadota bacterium]NIT65106.1 hypothetical protein [Gemmatimonadota bacterium]NIV23639.1 hypothetical protein [Gemmatimonadota bacterium]
MNDDADRIDFRAIDPTGDGERFDATVAAIMAAAGPELADRRYSQDALGQLAGWWRPLLAAAAVTAIVAIATLAGVDPDGRETQSGTGIAEALGMSEQVATWVRSSEGPDPAELLLTLEDDR